MSATVPPFTVVWCCQPMAEQVSAKATGRQDAKRKDKVVDLSISVNKEASRRFEKKVRMDLCPDVRWRLIDSRERRNGYSFIYLLECQIESK
jgi:hypothetical protein